MPITVNINGKSLCHKGSNGIVMATLPDVCKTPAPPAGPIPIPYPNIAKTMDLAKGTKKVKADKGQSCAIRGSEFSRSNGDEPGSVGGIISNVNMSKATWLLHSFNVFFEGKPVARLGDKMLMNKMNTVSLGGLMQMPLLPDQLIVELCEIACKCKDETYKQNCMAKEIRKQCYDKKGYPKDDAPVWCEASITKQPHPNYKRKRWQHVMNSGGSAGGPAAGTKPSSFPWTPKGGIRPDLYIPAANGNRHKIIEVKFPGDTPNKNQSPGGNYEKAAKQMKMDYEFLTIEDDCPCWAGGVDDSGDGQDNAAAQADMAALASPVNGKNMGK